MNQWTRQRVYAVCVYGASVLLAISVVACAGDSGFAPTRDPHQLLHTVRFIEHAYNLSTMSPYDTVRVSSTIELADGTVPSGLVTYSSVTPYVSIDSTGLVRAISRTGTGGGATAKIYVAATYGGQTLRDSAYVSVIDGPPPVIDSIQPSRLQYDEGFLTDLTVKLDSTGNLSSNLQNLEPGAFDHSGNRILGFAWDVTSSDTTVVTSQSYDGLTFYLFGRKPGHVWLHVNTYMYGVHVKDSLRVTAGERLLYFMQILSRDVLSNGLSTELYLYPDSMTIPSGSDVVFMAPPGKTYGARFAHGPYPSWPGSTSADSFATYDSLASPAVNIIFDDSQFVLASHIPPTYGTTQEYFDEHFKGYNYNEHGGSGNISFLHYLRLGTDDPFGNPCRPVLPVNCTDGDEARLFVRPGTYRYHTSSGLRGVIVVE